MEVNNFVFPALVLGAFVGWDKWFNNFL